MTNENKRMSDLIEEAKSVLLQTTVQVEKLQTLTELNEKQHQMYKEAIDRSIDTAERRWNNLRGVVISLVVFVLGLVFTASVNLNTKVSADELQEILREEDAASKTDVVRGMNKAIDDTFDYLERKGVGDHDEITIESTEAKLNAYKEITGYKTRSMQNN